MGSSDSITGAGAEPVAPQTKTVMERIEHAIVEDGFRKAFVKLNWILPFKSPNGNSWNQLEELSHALDTSILHNVMTDAINVATKRDKPALEPNAIVARMAGNESAMKAIYNHVFSREIVERNMHFGNKIRELICAGLLEYDVSEQNRLKTIRTFIKESQARKELEKEIKSYKQRQTIDEKTDLAYVFKSVDEAKKELANNVDTWKLHEKQTDNEVYETNARVDVEMAYTNDFTEHQLQYMAFARDYKEIHTYAKRVKAVRENEYASIAHNATVDLYERMCQQKLGHHNIILDAAEHEQAMLEEQLNQEAQALDDLESALVAARVAIQQHNETITRLIEIRAAEVAEEQKLVRFLNAVVRIQRWWRFKMWLQSKKKKKKRRERGKESQKESRRKNQKENQKKRQKESPKDGKGKE